MWNMIEGRKKHEHPSAVKCSGECFEVVGGAEPRVELGNICHPITMVWIPIGGARTLIILADGTDPY
jgi:hypothetical protein